MARDMTDREAKGAVLNVRLRPSVKAELERQAHEEVRSMADHIEYLVLQHAARKRSQQG